MGLVGRNFGRGPAHRPSATNFDVHSGIAAKKCGAFMQTRTPEAYLSTLVRRLRAVDAATNYLDEDARDSFSAELRQAQRDCQMTSLLYDHTVIAVAGDQGAGKTRLMRLLYDLDANWLDDKPGRGEYLPVLVLEDPNVGEVQGAIYSWADEAHPEEPRGRSVSAEQFKQAVRSWTGDALELPVLRVPPRYFGGQRNHGFLLLPGYEKITSKNRPWQEFMRLALVASSTCILVTNNDLLAQQQDAIQIDLQKNQLAGVHPIIAITSADKYSADRLQQLRETAAERFGVPLNGVVCTGIGDRDYEDEVRNSILDALGRQGGIGSGARARQLEELEGISRQISMVVSAARQAVNKNRDSNLEHEELHSDILDVLDKSVDDIRRKYQIGLKEAFKNIENNAIKAFENKFEEEEEGWMATGRDIKDRALLKGSRADKRMAGHLKSAVKSAGGGQAFAAKHANLLGELSKHELSLLAPSDSQPALPNDEAGHSTDIAVAAPSPATETLKALTLIMAKNRTAEDTLLFRQHAKELKKAVKHLPAIATSYMSAMQSLVVASTIDGKMPTTDLREILQNTAQTTVEMHGLATSLLKAAVGVLALDVAVDGEIDSIPALINVVAGGWGSTAGSTAIAAGGPVGMAIGSAVLAYGFISSLEKHQAKAKAYGVEAIRNSLQEQMTGHIAYFDEMMRLLAQRFSDQLETVLGLDQSLGERLRALREIHELRNARSSFLDQMRGQEA